MESMEGHGRHAPLFLVLRIYAHETLPEGIIAQLDGSRLFVDPSAPTEQQLDAIADAVQALRTGQANLETQTAAPAAGSAPEVGATQAAQRGLSTRPPGR